MGGGWVLGPGSWTDADDGPATGQHGSTASKARSGGERFWRFSAQPAWVWLALGSSDRLGTRQFLGTPQQTPARPCLAQAAQSLTSSSYLLLLLLPDFPPSHLQIISPPPPRTIPLRVSRTGQNVADKRQTGTHTQLRARLARHSLFTIRPISNSGSGSAQDFGFGFGLASHVPTLSGWPLASAR